jgi:hypothetical protein
MSFFIMESFKKLPNSVRKFIRTRKAQIRRQFWDIKKQNEEIMAMYKKLSEVAVKATPVPEIKKEVKTKPKTKVKKVKKA